MLGWAANIAAAHIDAGELEDARLAWERGIAHMGRSACPQGHWLPHLYCVSALELSGDERGTAAALQTMAESIRGHGGGRESAPSPT